MCYKFICSEQRGCYWSQMCCQWYVWIIYPICQGCLLSIMMYTYFSHVVFSINLTHIINTLIPGRCGFEFECAISKCIVVISFCYICIFGGLLVGKVTLVETSNTNRKWWTGSGLPWNRKYPSVWQVSRVKDCAEWFDQLHENFQCYYL